MLVVKRQQGNCMLSHGIVRMQLPRVHFTWLAGRLDGPYLSKHHSRIIWMRMQLIFVYKTARIACVFPAVVLVGRPVDDLFY
jgi:hypothetical protein